MDVEHVQTKQEIQQRLSLMGIRPRKRLGQHFLIDGNLMRRLADRAEIGADDLVLEVGGGTGALTDLLVARARRVVCVEIDRDLHAGLKERFNLVDKLHLICGDILESKHRILTDVAREIRGYDGGASGRVKLVANLPYQIATPLVMNLLVDHPEVRRLVFSVQAEVGDRITARQGCRDYGPLSIVSQLLCRVEQVARMPPQAFWPRPAVHSAMIRMDVAGCPLDDPREVGDFSTLVRGVFDHRRKTLRSALGYVVDEATREQVCQEVDATRRPESFGIEEWLDIFRFVRSRNDEST